MAGLAVDLAVDQDVGALLVVIPMVAGGELKYQFILPSSGFQEITLSV